MCWPAILCSHLAHSTDNEVERFPNRMESHQQDKSAEKTLSESNSADRFTEARDGLPNSIQLFILFT